ncbi:hypothetical protein DXG01_009544 [Tephrocybe rancida]|nr:hypothetical protein DXG01_009544 [Tephrocybe rancida]
MRISFDPALPGTIHVPVNSSSAILNFTATLSAPDYNELEKDGGRLQLWSNFPSEDAPTAYDGWASRDFEDEARNRKPLGSTYEIPLLLGGGDIDDTPLSTLTLNILVPLSNNQQTRFSFTYRILYPSGEIRWLGEFGQNGTAVFEYTTTETALGLVAGWTRKDGVYTWSRADEANQAETTVLRLTRPHDYGVWTPCSPCSPFLAFITRQKNRRISVPPEYLLCASPHATLRFQSDETLVVSGTGSLMLCALPHRQAELDLLKDAILEHCSSGRVAVTAIGEGSTHLLVSTKSTVPVEGIVVGIPTRNTLLSVPTETLRALLPAETTSSPLSLLVPQAGEVHLITDSPSVTFTTPQGPFVLSSAFNITTKVYISIMSPYMSATLVEVMAGVLPTPPPSPELVPRLVLMPDHHSSSNLSEHVPLIQDLSLVSEEEEDDMLVQDGDNDEIVPLAPRLRIPALVLHVRYVLFMALFILELAFKMFFGKITANPEDPGEDEEAEVREHGQEHSDEHVHADPGEMTEATQTDADDDAPNQDMAIPIDGPPINDSENEKSLSIPLESLDLATNVGPGVSRNPGLSLEIKNKALLVEIGGGGGAAKLAVWGGDARGAVMAEINGKPVSVDRRKDLFQTPIGFEIWEFEADIGGVVRITYDREGVSS